MVVRYRKTKDFRRINTGNRTARTGQQIFSARLRMLIKNPMKEAKNQLKQSSRMAKNQFWKLRKKQLIKQQPSG